MQAADSVSRLSCCLARRCLLRHLSDMRCFKTCITTDGFLIFGSQSADESARALQHGLRRRTDISSWFPREISGKDRNAPPRSETAAGDNSDPRQRRRKGAASTRRALTDGQPAALAYFAVASGSEEMVD